MVTGIRQTKFPQTARSHSYRSSNEFEMCKHYAQTKPETDPLADSRISSQTNQELTDFDKRNRSDVLTMCC